MLLCASARHARYDEHSIDLLVVRESVRVRVSLGHAVHFVDDHNLIHKRYTRVSDPKIQGAENLP